MPLHLAKTSRVASSAVQEAVNFTPQVGICNAPTRLPPGMAVGSTSGKNVLTVSPNFYGMSACP
eukprot:7203484-Karenia_brevis.AAC.1